RAPSMSLNAYSLSDELRTEASQAYLNQNHSQATLERQLAPDAIVECGELPIYMDFNTLNRCNVSCTMCPPAIRHDKQGIKRDPYYRLSLEEYKKITKGIRIQTAHFVGAYAEPLLNKEIFSLVAYAKGDGAFTAITTNATALNRQFGERLLD